MSQEVLATIKSYVAGELTPAAFRDRLYADADAFEAFLTHDPTLSPTNYVKGSAFHFLLELDYDDAGDQLNAQGALAEYMDRNGISYTRTSRYQDFHRLLLSAQPRWLDVDVKWVQEQLMPLAGDRTGTALRKWLRAELLARFRYVKKPPRWIQSPRWPIGPSGPLVFLGQIDVDNYFHDAATVYVFHDQATGQCETLIQCY
jgi:hypothetical protein